MSSKQLSVKADAPAYDTVGTPLFSPHMENDARMFRGRIRPHSGAALASEARSMLHQHDDGAASATALPAPALSSSPTPPSASRPASSSSSNRALRSSGHSVHLQALDGSTKSARLPPRNAPLSSSSRSLRRPGSASSLRRSQRTTLRHLSVDAGATPPSLPASQDSPLHELGHSLFRSSLAAAPAPAAAVATVSAEDPGAATTATRRHHRTPSTGWASPPPEEAQADTDSRIRARMAALQADVGARVHMSLKPHRPQPVAATPDAPVASAPPTSTVPQGGPSTSPIGPPGPRNFHARAAAAHGNHPITTSPMKPSRIPRPGAGASPPVHPHPPASTATTVKAAPPRVEKFGPAGAGAGASGTGAGDGGTRPARAGRSLARRPSKRLRKGGAGSSRRKRDPSPGRAAAAPVVRAGGNAISLVNSVQGAALRAAVVCGSEVWSAHGYHISIRDATTGDVKHEMATDAHQSIVWCFVVVGRHVWAGTSTGPINIYDAKKRTLVKTARHHAGGVHTLATGVDSGLVFSGSNDFTCVMWSARGDFKKLYAGHSNGVRCTLALGPMLWTGSDDHTIRVWDTNKCECKAVLTGHVDSVLGLSAGSGGTSVWSASSDGTLRQWALQDPHECTKVVEVGQRVNCLAPVGDTMWSCGAEPVIRVWRTRDFTNLRALEGHTGFVGSLLQVRRVESHWLWSYGQGDKVLNIWRQDSSISGSRDASELLAMAQAANRLYEPMIAAVEKEKEDVARNSQALREKLTAVEEKLSELDTRESALSNNEIEVTSAINDVLMKLAIAEERLQEQTSATKRAEAQHSSLAAEVRRLKADNDALRTTVSERESSVADATAQAKEAQRHASQLQLALDAAQKNAKSASEAQAAQGEELHLLRRQVAQHEAVRRKMDAQVLDLQQQLAALRQEHDDGRATTEGKIAELVAQAARDTIKIAELEDGKKTAQQAADAAAAKVREAEEAAVEHMAQIAQATQRVAELEEAISAAEAAAAAQKEQHAELRAELTKKLENLRRKHQHDVVSLKTARASAQASEQEVERLTGVATAAEARIATLEAAATKATTELDAAREEMEEQAYSLDQRETDLSEAQEQLKDLQKRVKLSEAQLTTLRQQNTDVASAEAGLRSQVVELESQVEEAKAAVAAGTQREQALEKRFMELDVFKLDTIAAALKAVDADVTRVRKDVTAFDAKSFSNYGDRERVVALTRRLSEELALLRSQTRDVLVDCLDEMEARRLGLDVKDEAAAGEAFGLSVARREFGNVLANIQRRIKAGETFGD